VSREHPPDHEEVVEERSGVGAERAVPEVVLRVPAAEDVARVALPLARPGRRAVAARARRPLELMQLEHDDHPVPACEGQDGIDDGAEVVEIDLVGRGLEVAPRDRQPDDVHAPRRHLREVALLGRMRRSEEIAELEARVIHAAQQDDAAARVADPRAVAREPPAGERRPREHDGQQDRERPSSHRRPSHAAGIPREPFPRQGDFAGA
jgi:hypothetical protein